MSAWDEPGWAVEVDAWIDDQLALRDRCRSGPSRPLQQWCLSALIQVPVDDGGVVLKASCDHFRAEPAITRFVADLAPGLVPEVIAIDEQRSWMLMGELTVVEDRTTTTAVATAAALAQLQVIMLDHLDALIARGLPDRRLTPTLAALETVGADGVELDRLSAQEQDLLRRLLPWVGRVLTELTDTGPPASLGHGDLHLGNVALRDGAPVIFDWSDASLTWPLLDVALISYDSEQPEQIRRSYAHVWRDAFPDIDLARAMTLLPVADRAFQAVTYDTIFRAVPGASEAMSGVQARILRALIEQWTLAGQPAG